MKISFLKKNNYYLLLFFSFLDLGGETKGAAKHLSGSYSGLPLMVNTLLDWLHAAGSCNCCMLF